MENNLQAKVRRLLLTTILILYAAVGWSQIYQQGIRKGMVKVKFSPTVTSTLSKMDKSARKDGVATSITSFDAAAKQVHATSMHRLFPYDAKYENKLRKHGLHLWYVIEIGESQDPQAVASQFGQLSEVEIAEVEHEKVVEPFSVQPYQPKAGTTSAMPFDDPLLPDQWHYNNTGQSGFGDADANLFEAWQSVTGANDIIVSVHDQGVDVNHEDLADNIWTNEAELNGTTGVDDDGNGYIDDIHGYNFTKNQGKLDAEFHGTHVAGTISAVNNNGVGVSGVAGGDGSGNGVKVMSLEILGGAAIENSYIYAANNGAVISQNSWGYTSPYYFDESVQDAIDYFVAEAGDYDGSPMKGGIVIFASGNSNSDDEWYPGYYESTFAVSAIGPEWKKASYSNYGDWVELSAPGGDQDSYNGINGVLSTIPDNKYAYLQGTSMACPHVSGIAALVLANRNHQLVPAELWNKLLTGTVSIDDENPDYIGKLGTGAIDAALAIKNNEGVAPAAITDLMATGIAQEFATFSWTVPVDEDDNQPTSFIIYYASHELTADNLATASKVTIPNAQEAGTAFSFELDDLLGLTTYHFAVVSVDRWGNISALSNVISETTNEGPAIAVDPISVDMTIDAATTTTASADITILNEATGILRWEYFMRHKSTSLAYSAAGIEYPVSTGASPGASAVIGKVTVDEGNIIRAESNEPQATAYTQREKSFSDYATNIIGETDLSLPNSALGKFYVSDEDGFNLTQVKMYLKHDPAKGPVVVEIFKGSTPAKENLVYAQEWSSWGNSETWAYVTLDEQLYFEQGETFWVAFHIPADNLYPLGIGYELEPSGSSNCYMSFDVGATWQPLEEAIGSKDFAWAMSAVSQNAHLGTYLTLDPVGGDIDGNAQETVTLSADASGLINGTYNANLVLASNDAANQELRVPVSVIVSGHQPGVKHPDVVDYGSVFIGEKKTIEIVLDNQGYGNFNSPTYAFNSTGTSLGTNFTLTTGSGPWQIKAREQAILQVDFVPINAGNSNDVLTISNGTYTYEIALFGVGAETSEITVTPESQTMPGIAIGDEVNAQVTIENTGQYPLKYFIPGYDVDGISEDWPTDYHAYGYKIRSNYASEANPLVYDFQDISSTGVKITDQLKDDGAYATVDMGFNFPYYGEDMTTIYIAQKGFTVFDNSVRPVNTPTLGNSYSPDGYISLLGTYFDLSAHGDIYYQKMADRLIIQYQDMTDGYNGDITAQMVLFANGDIRFYYENMGWSSDAQKYLNVLIEDMQNEDGILLNNYQHQMDLSTGTALGFDYPGPDIITNIDNGSGILMPGASAVADITMNTTSLVEGLTKRYINIISNDPANSQKQALIALDITSGGTAMPILSTNEIAFGDVFRGAVVSETLRIKNEGTANVDITSLVLTNGNFNVAGDQPTSITPGTYKNYAITIPTVSNGLAEDVLTINYGDGSSDEVMLSGTVVDPPAIVADLSLIQQTLNYGETMSIPYTIENTGLADLKVTTQGKQWLSFEADGVVPDSVSYHYEKYNTSADGVYQWIDIRETGTHMPFAEDVFEPADFWRDYTMPFEFEYYGEKYTDIKIGDNGIVSFDANPEVMVFQDKIPTEGYVGRFIMPYWTFSGFDTYTYPEDEVGIFYQEYDDKVIITWSYLVNNFGGMGDPISAQLFLYKNGTMKFQYKVEQGFGGGDQTSTFTSIGVQGSFTNGVPISISNNLDHGDGLAFVLVPTRQLTVAPGATLSGNINLDAQNVYGGVYNANFNIASNVPGSELVQKPVELTVVGEGALGAPENVDFGLQVVELDQWGSPVQHYMDVDISNSGTAALDITGIAMADGAQSMSLQVYMLVDGWFGPEWMWIDITDPWSWTNPTITLKPGENLVARAVFSPTTEGVYTDDVVLTTSLGTTNVTLAGTGYLPPVMEVDKTAVEVAMNTPDEQSSPSIAISNTGDSDLTYEVSIAYGRTGVEANAEAMAQGTDATLALGVSKTPVKPGTVISASYHRIISHTDATVPETHIGTGGAAPFTVATKYNAGAEGFNLSHVVTWLRAEDVESGLVEVEIRAGSTAINKSVTIAKTETWFTRSGDDENGDWLTIPMDAPVGLYPNEDFYVVVTLPLGIGYPQGSITDESVAGRYFYKDEGVWHDMQGVSGFETTGWLMYAAEDTPGETGWLSITSDGADVLAPSASGTINLKIDGAVATRGDQVANVVVASNDPNNPTDSIQVTLHMNEAPTFSGMAERYSIAEGGELEINLTVTDVEDNTFSVDAEAAYTGLSYTLTGSDLEIVYSPIFGDEGSYEFTFVATDEYGAANKTTVMVDVTHANQAPVFVDPSMTLEYTETGVYKEYVFDDYFTDPDGDGMTYTIVSNDEAIVKAFAAGDNFVIQTNAFGAGSVTITATDINGASTAQDVDVLVTEIANNAPEFVGDKELAFEELGKTTEFDFSTFFSDPDGDDLTYEIVSNDEAIVKAFTAGDNFVIQTHAFGAGSVTITATDVNGASTAQDVDVLVTEIPNTAPEFIGVKELAFDELNKTTEFEFSSFFSDADGDAMSFVASSLDESVASVYASNDMFLIKANAEGETAVAFEVTDSHGAMTMDTVNVMIKAPLISAVEPKDLANTLSVFPNPTKGTLYIKMPAKTDGKYIVRVLDMLGTVVIEKGDAIWDQYGAELDLSKLTGGTYFIEISDDTARSISRIVKE